MKRLVVSIAVSAAFGGVAQAAELMTNGDFETGNFSGWTVTDLAGGSGSWNISAPGSPTPISGFGTSAAGGGAHGSFYAVTDQTGPGTHALAQSFVVGAGATVTLQFDMFANNQAGVNIVDPAGLDHTAGANEHSRVDILSGSASAFDTGAGVLANYYLGSDSFANPNPFTHYSFDISSVVAAGGTFQIRFGEVDNQFFYNMGVDNVSVSVAAIPEPETYAMMLAGLGLLGFAARRRKHKAVAA